MADPTGKVKPGDGLNRLFQAATFNLTMDTVNDYLRRARGRTGAAGNAPDPIVPATLIYVKNATGSTLLPYSVVSPNGTPIYDPADEPVGQQQQPLIEVIAPASDSDVVLITQEEIADGEIGLAASAGVCVAAVAVSSGTHKFAAPSAGVTTSLASGTSGPVRILEPWSSGTGERLVLIGSQEASAGGSITVKEVDGSPSVSSVTELRFDQADGFVVSAAGAGVARVDMQVASLTQTGVVTFSAQTFGGSKGVSNGTTGFGFMMPGTAVTNATAYSTAPAAVAATPPDGISDPMLWIGSSAGQLRGTMTATEPPDGTHGSDLWLMPGGHLFGDVYTGRLIVGGRYAVWEPSSGYISTGIDDSSGGYQFVGGVLVGGTYSGGTVSSVAISAPGIFSVSGSPVTGSGTITLSLGSQTANTVFAGPTSGGAVAPTFRSLVPADMPTQGAVTDLTDSTGGTPGTTVAAVSGTGDDAGINDALASLIATINALQAELRLFKAVS